MNAVSVIGIIASVCTALSMIPQLAKVVKEKTASDISVFMLIILFSGVGCWIAYGILKNDWIIIVSNSVSFVINTILIVLTLKYKQTT